MDNNILRERLDLLGEHGIPVGAFVVWEKRNAHAIVSALRKRQFLKHGRNVTPYHDPETHRTGLAIHVSSAAAVAMRTGSGTLKTAILMNGKQKEFPPTPIPDMLRSGAVEWRSNLRVCSSACLGIDAGNTCGSSLPQPATNLQEPSSTVQTQSHTATHAPTTFIELFAGIGGFRCALQHLGCRCVFTSEIDAEAREILEKNFPESSVDQQSQASGTTDADGEPRVVPVVVGDITHVDAADIPDHDILTAGFPCQSFSRAGTQQGFNDDRGVLFLEITRILHAKQPAGFILENVANLLDLDDGAVMTTILAELRRAGYVVSWRVVNARAVLPQQRTRLYFVGIRNDVARHAPPQHTAPLPKAASTTPPSSLPSTKRARTGSTTPFTWPLFPILDITLADILETLPCAAKQPDPDRHRPAEDGTQTHVQTARYDDYKLTPHQFAKVAATDDWRRSPDLRLVGPQSCARTLMSNYKSGYALKSEFVPWATQHAVNRRCHVSSGLLNPDLHDVAHDTQVRAPRFYTPRECARMQGFPETFSPCDASGRNATRAYHQLGNAVSPVVIAAIADRLLECLPTTHPYAASSCHNSTTHPRRRRRTHLGDLCRGRQQPTASACATASESPPSDTRGTHTAAESAASAECGGSACTMRALSHWALCNSHGAVVGNSVGVVGAARAERLRGGL
eukprot:m.547496 g.547496  ORF g.547496 m.547496 type:complete len:683 (-) comp22155_c0_seq82:4015-6063(-)